MARAGRRKKGKPGGEVRASGSGARRLALAVLSIAALGAAAWGVVATRVRATELIRAEQVSAHIVWPVSDGGGESWIGPSFREEITARVESQLSGRPIDAATLASLGESLAASGWFDGEPEIRRTADDAVTVSGRWRRPACVVRAGPRDYVIDWSGRPMPIDYAAGSSGMRTILGVAAPAPLDAVGNLIASEPWPGEDVAAALELLAPLLAEPFADQVAGIDVSAYYTVGRLSIVTDSGAQVVWGGRFGEFVPGEAPSDEKLARLRNLAASPQFGSRIDTGVSRLEIFDEQGVAIDLTERP